MIIPHKTRWDAVLLDAIYVLAAVIFVLLLRFQTAEFLGDLVLLIGIAAIYLVTAFYMPLRLTPLMISLADRRRREELALTPLDPREYLWQYFKRPLIRLPSLIVCTTLPIAEIRLPKEQDFLWILPLATLVFGAFMMLFSLSIVFILFRWLCRSPRDTLWAWLVSFLAVLIGFATSVLLYIFDGTMSELAGGNVFVFFGLYITELIGGFFLARRLWRRCWTKYFVFD